MLSFKIQSPCFKIEDFLIVTKKWVWAKKGRKQTPSQIEFQVGSTFFLFLLRRTVQSQITICRPVSKLWEIFQKHIFFQGAFNTPKSFQNPNCHISLETLDNLWYFGWLRFFIFKLLSQSFFVWKKKYWKNHKKCEGAILFICPKRTLVVKQSC